MKPKEVIYIGQRFYRESHTRMSPYYEVNRYGEWQRLAIGEIETYIDSGQSVLIRPANRAEMRRAEEMLIRGTR